MGMDSLFAIKGKGFVVLAADSHAAFSVIRLKDDEDKLSALDANKIMAAAGPQGDRRQFVEYIQKNLALYRLRTNNTLSLSTHAAAHYTRGELAHALRSKPFQVDCLIGGYDKDKGAQLYFLDYLASMQEVNKAAHGYAAMFVLGLMDRYWTPEITEAEGIEIIKKCIDEMKTRFIIKQQDFTIKVVNENGIKVIQ